MPPPARKQHIVVNGGAGFIGSHLCDRLVQKGHQVTCVDNLATERFENVRPLLNHGNFEFLHADVREPIEIDGPVDRIYNLACPASPPHYQSDPIGTIRTCVLGAYHALELARATGARVLQASTSEVYGDPEIHPQPESYRGAVNPIGPRACYDEGKRCAEAVFFDYRRLHGAGPAGGRPARHDRLLRPEAVHQAPSRPGADARRRARPAQAPSGVVRPRPSGVLTEAALAHCAGRACPRSDFASIGLVIIAFSPADFSASRLSHRS